MELGHLGSSIPSPVIDSPRGLRMKCVTLFLTWLTWKWEPHLTLKGVVKFNSLISVQAL